MLHNRKHDVLFVLKIPPPYGGGEIEHQYIYDALKENYNFVLFSRRSHNKSKQGRMLLSNLFFGLLMMGRVLFACAIHWPKVVFIWLPKDVPAYMRTILLVSFLRLFGIKFIGDLHGMGFQFLRRRTNRWYFGPTINAFEAIRVLSPKIGERIRDAGYRNNIVPIDNGIVAPNILKVKKTLFEQPIKLLYLGAISESKGFFRVLKLMKDLDRLNIRFFLNVVGEWVSGHFRQDALGFIDENRLTSYIAFSGVKLDDEKWKILWKSHLLLHFSAWDGQPLTIIEAMAAGVPSIATPVGAITEMIEHNVDGFLIDRVDQATHIIRELLDDRIDYDAISSTARRTYERRFTVEKYIKDIKKLVQVQDHAASDPISENR